MNPKAKTTGTQPYLCFVDEAFTEIGEIKDMDKETTMTVDNDACEIENDCNECDCDACPIEEMEFIEEFTTGSKLIPIDGDLHLFYLDEFNEPLGCTELMPDIINVSRPNERTVFVEFADGSKEVAKLNEGDTFSLETGILICIIKKIFADSVLAVSGSSVYNKVIKYALTKLDATKKAREEQLKRIKAERMRQAKLKQEARRAENKERAECIRMIKDAIKAAADDISVEASKDLANDFNELLKGLEKDK